MLTKGVRVFSKMLRYLFRSGKAVARKIGPLRAAWRMFISRIDIDTYHGMMGLSIIETGFRELKETPIFDRREGLWDECIAIQGGAEAKITYVEFGVYEGYSIKYFARKNHNQSSVFIGLDSFEGLPEDWGRFPKGTFSTDGNLPITEDSRINFIKGWFQFTWDALSQRLSQAETLVVHYDADLYSSTLFALTKIDCLNKKYIAIFDEFSFHEARALYDYIQAYGASVSFLGKTLNGGFPYQVMCRVVPMRA